MHRLLEMLSCIRLASQRLATQLEEIAARLFEWVWVRVCPLTLGETMHVPAVIFPVANVQQTVAEASQVRTVGYTLMAGNKLDRIRKLALKQSSRALPDLGNAVAMPNRRSAGELQLGPPPTEKIVNKSVDTHFSLSPMCKSLSPAALKALHDPFEACHLQEVLAARKRISFPTASALCLPALQTPSLTAASTPRIKFRSAAFGAALSAAKIVSLSELNWTLQSRDGLIKVPALVPSQIHLDLKAAGVITEPLLDINDFTQRWIVPESWAYQADLSPFIQQESQTTNSSKTLLVFYGLDTVATINVAGHPVAWVNNQFQEYVYDITE
ncbi:hypothetical protein NUW54_g1029 [Trametes sanguinea]|uniref:Uncharacterized protein n=1 Tax=Trametes sanguinea TaxID=158606 RepID=A0ACC1QA95_9APHY|nr:hypothetical protein NUW54_g1029 [Trametes sanguinea]